MSYSKKEIERIFYSIDNLPTLPVIAVQLLELIEKEASMKKISHIINNDPAIAAKILKIANSAYFGARCKVDTVERALVILGINEVSNIVLGLSFLTAFPWKQIDDRFNVVKFWEHSIFVAQTAKLMAKYISMETHGEEYTAGLLHDIGKLILSYYFQNDFVKILDLVFKSDYSTLEAEEKVIGYDHSFLGYLLTKKWNLPLKITKSIKLHHEPEEFKDNKLPAIIYLSDYLAHKLGVFPTEKKLLYITYDEIREITEQVFPKFNLEKFESILEQEFTKIKEITSTFLDTSL